MAVISGNSPTGISGNSLTDISAARNYTDSKKRFGKKETPVTNLERERGQEPDPVREPIGEREIRGKQHRESGIGQEMDRLLSDLGSGFCAFGLLQQGSGELVWEAAVGNLSDRYRRMATRPGKGLNGSVVKVGRGAAFHVAELIAKRELHEYPILLAEKLRSAYAAPVMEGDKVRGVLLVGDRVKRIYRPEDRERIASAVERMAKLLAHEQA